MFDYVPDQQIAWLCFIFFFILSPILTYVLYRLPAFSWTMVSVFGIFSVITAVTLFVWIPRYGWSFAFQLWGDCFVVFTAALPPLFFLDLWQWLRIKKFQQRQETDEAVCFVGTMHSILAKLDSILSYLTNDPVEDISHN